MYDVIICGSGPAGMSSALFLKRANLDILIIEKGTPGGKLVSTALIENYPGYIDNTGIDLAMIMYRQVKNLKIPYAFTEVVSIEKVADEHFKVYTNDGIYEAKNVIWAAGTVAKLLNTKGEQEFVGRGISYCAICDGTFHANQDVVVIGGGNSGVEEALFLSKMCKNVTVITRGLEFRADEVLMEKAKNAENITLMSNQEVLEFDGGILLDKVRVRNRATGLEQTLHVNGAFIYIGLIPSSTILQNFDILDSNKYIQVDENCETKVRGLYAAGDCIVKGIRQVATAVSDGVLCASAIVKKI